jgi:DNA invertase Pin-like site-specific DNA recombinase
MSPQTREAVYNNILQFHVKGQKQRDAPEGITACYERLSQEDKLEGESNSIANQKKMLERYYKEHGYTPVCHYDADDGYSGTTFDRPGFQSMLADIKAGRIARVIVKDMSRFGRDYLQVGMYTDILFPQFGVHFIAVNDGVDSRRGDNEFTAIRNVFNEMYARDTSKKIRATWQSKGRSGEHLGSNPPYGYLKDPIDRSKWIVDEEAAVVVQKIYALCTDGLGPTQIARRLKEEGILAPSAYCRSKGRTPPARELKDPCGWCTEVVSAILERVDYLGHTVNFKTTKQSYKVNKKLYNNPEEWAVFENTQEPIIEESVFLTVQHLRKSRQRPNRMGTTGMFSGLLFCADCKGRLYQCRATRFRPEQEYYICSTYRKDRFACSTHSIRTVVLAEIVLRDLREAIAYVSRFEKDFIREASEMSVQKHNGELARRTSELAKAERRCVELDAIIKHLYEDNVTGKLTDERFVKLSRDYEQEQSHLSKTCETLRRDAGEHEQKGRDVKSFIAIAKKYTNLKELDAAVLREFIARIYISAKDKKNKTRRVEIVYNFIGAFDFKAAQGQKAAPLKAVGAE